MIQTLLILLGLFVVINVGAETVTTTDIEQGTPTIQGTQTVLPETGTPTQLMGTQTTITQKEERNRIILTLTVPVLGKLYQANIFYVQSLKKYEAILYLDDSEAVAFFDMADEWRRAISVRIYQIIEKQLLLRTNCAEAIATLEGMKGD